MDFAKTTEPLKKGVQKRTPCGKNAVVSFWTCYMLFSVAAEGAFHSIKERLFMLMCLFSIQRSNLAKQIFLLVIQLTRCNHNHFHMLISLTHTAQAWYAFAFETEIRSRL